MHNGYVGRWSIEYLTVLSRLVSRISNRFDGKPVLVPWNSLDIDYQFAIRSRKTTKVSSGVEIVREAARTHDSSRCISKNEWFLCSKEIVRVYTRRGTRVPDYDVQRRTLTSDTEHTIPLSKVSLVCSRIWRAADWDFRSCQVLWIAHGAPLS